MQVDIENLENRKSQVSDAALRGDTSAIHHLEYIEHELHEDKSRLYNAQLMNLSILASVFLGALLLTQLTS